MELFYPEKLFDLSKERKLFLATIYIHRLISVYKMYLDENNEDPNSWKRTILGKYRDIEEILIKDKFCITENIYKNVMCNKKEFNEIINKNINTEDEDAEEEQIVLNCINAIDEYFDVILEKDDIQARMYIMLHDCHQGMSYSSDYDGEAENAEIEWQTQALDIVSNSKEEIPFNLIDNLNRKYNSNHKDWMQVEVFEGVQEYDI